MLIAPATYARLSSIPVFPLIGVKKLWFSMLKLPHISAKANPVKSTTVEIELRLMDL